MTADDEIEKKAWQAAHEVAAEWIDDSADWNIVADRIMERLRPYLILAEKAEVDKKEAEVWGEAYRQYCRERRLLTAQLAAKDKLLALARTAFDAEIAQLRQLEIAYSEKAEQEKTLEEGMKAKAYSLCFGSMASRYEETLAALSQQDDGEPTAARVEGL